MISLIHTPPPSSRCSCWAAPSPQRAAPPPCAHGSCLRCDLRLIRPAGALCLPILHCALSPPGTQVCTAAATDTLPPTRRAANALHDVVVVSAVRTPMCKVRPEGVQCTVSCFALAHNLVVVSYMRAPMCKVRSLGEADTSDAQLWMGKRHQTDTLTVSLPTIQGAVVGGFEDTPIDDASESIRLPLC